MGWRVGCKTGLGLCALAFCADWAATVCLVGPHDNVDEPLEEVAFAGWRDAPGCFERFVGCEPLAGASERESELIRTAGIFDVRHGNDPACWG